MQRLPLTILCAILSLYAELSPRSVLAQTPFTESLQPNRAMLALQSDASGPPAIKRSVVPQKLDQLLSRIPWNAADRGPLLAVYPTLTTVTGELPKPKPDGRYELSTALPAFDRKLFECGSLSVIAPTQMVVIQDTPRQLPNFYDGLPRAMKVNYLLATLTDDQWKRLREKGLGVNDLTADQRPVYLSLLPDPFRIDRLHLDEHGKEVQRDTVALTPEQRQQVRMRVVRTLNVELPFMYRADTYGSFHPIDSVPIPPNSIRLRRNREEEQKADTLFGVKLRSLVANKFKTSQLNYAATRFNATVLLTGTTTVGELIARVAAATGVEITVDGREAQSPIFLRGERARAGDILKALALAVTGTYRKVDTAYVLTNDLVGTGTRQLRLAEWQSQVKVEIQRRDEEMKDRIRQHSGQTGGINALGYAPNDPYALPPAVDAEVRSRMFSAERTLQVDTLPPALQSAIVEYAEKSAEQDPKERQRDDRATLRVYHTFLFQLADGTLLDEERDLLSFESDFVAPPKRKASTVVTTTTITPLPLPSAATNRLLFLTPHNEAEVRDAIQAARRYGFNSLALRTEDAALLRTAIAASTANKGGSLRIYAVVAPFATDLKSDTAASVLDRNLLGETAQEVVAARNQLQRWPDYLRRLAEIAVPPPIPERVIGVSSALAPLGPGLTDRFRHIADLAATRGLAGFLLCDTQPSGYAGKRPASNTIDGDYNDLALPERENLGYSLPMRLAFLRKTGEDPIDIAPNGLNLDIDLWQPFFPDFGNNHVFGWFPLEGAKFAQEIGAQWASFLGEANRAAIAELYSTITTAIPNLPLFIEARPEWINDERAPRYLSIYLPWTHPDALPLSTMELVRPTRTAGDGTEQRIQPLLLSATEIVPARKALTAELKRLNGSAPDRGPTVAFDMSYLSVNQALGLLKDCVLPSGNGPGTNR